MVTRALGLRFQWWAALFGGVALVLAIAFSRVPEPVLEIQTDRPGIPAGGSATHLTIRAAVPLAASGLEASIAEGRHSARIGRIYFDDGAWHVTVQSKALPGRVRVAMRLAPFPPAVFDLTVGDGPADILRLDDPADATAFRFWFTYLTEAQFFRDTSTLPAEVSDCAALIRYAYRESLRAHDAAWAKTSGLPLVPAIPSIQKYDYPYTPWGAALFRTGPSDHDRGEFADAATLLRFNTRFVARDPRQAKPGDLLFFHNEESTMPYHSMVYLGASQIENAAGPFVAYHTGPQEGRPGEVRRPSIEELRKHPDPGWHPVAENPHYLGVYRWNILSQ
jgi:uncharacterized protein YfaT (DUF1175 family)